MKCSNPLCWNEFDEPANKLGECAPCHAKHDLVITNGRSAFSEAIVRWMKEVESHSGETIFYSDQFEALNNKGTFVLSTHQLDETLDRGVAVKQQTRETIGFLKTHLNRSPSAQGISVKQLPSEMIKMLSSNGVAEGFVGVSKNFRLMTAVAPSDAIRSFVTGRLTVCECEGVAMVVFLNAICDLLGPKIFDLAFAGLMIDSTSFTRHEKPFISKQMKPNIQSIGVGDWIYLAHETSQSLEKFHDLAKKCGKGAAASGWNLVCVDGSGPTAKFLGFGMSCDEGGMLLSEIKDRMIKEVGGDPASRAWSLIVHLRIRPNLKGLAGLVKQRISFTA